MAKMRRKRIAFKAKNIFQISNDNVWYEN